MGELISKMFKQSLGTNTNYNVNLSKIASRIPYQFIFDGRKRRSVGAEPVEAAAGTEEAEFALVQKVYDSIDGPCYDDYLQCVGDRVFELSANAVNTKEFWFRFRTQTGDCEVTHRRCLARSTE